MTFIIHPVILCGGSGTRLWPLSTPDRPKQFLQLTSPQSMIEETADRFRSSERPDLSFAQALVIGSARHQQLLTTKLPGAKKILEPIGRNSAPAVAAACLASDPDDLILILPADHDIRDVPSFHAAIAVAAAEAEEGSIVTFGIEPTHPATGYGYIEAATQGTIGRATKVEAFVEKPDIETAQAYLDAGTYYWNAGIFLFRASIMLEALETFAPNVLSGTAAAMGQETANVRVLEKETFAATPSISIDYAVMENAKNIKAVPVKMGWSDVGGYRALHELLTDSRSDNCAKGPVHIQNSKGLYVHSEGPVISVNGVSDLVIVATEDEVMITPLLDDAAVKELGKAVQSNRQVLGISTELRQQAKDWLWAAFDMWSQNAWDKENGGFVEQLSMDGVPDLEENRRVRVQARQVFSFAKAIEMRWPGSEKAVDLVANGLHYIDTRLRHADGGFVHLIDHNGGIIDDRRDLYDHAFIILAGATAFNATGNRAALKIAQDALDYVNSNLKDEEHGGWFESNKVEAPRRANPHMHMLEAMLEYHRATGSNVALDCAAEVVRLFENKFFNPATNIMSEFFTNDWQTESDRRGSIWEPGHHYEWATLLSHYDRLTEHDSESWRRRLIRKADEEGLDPNTGFAVNACLADGTPANSRMRLWPQLERFRTYTLHTRVAGTSRAETLLEAILRTYLTNSPEGGWIDELDESGKADCNAVPASMLYHLVTALEVFH